MGDVATAERHEPSCEGALKNCSSADLSSLNSYADCLQQAVSSIQCKWFTEADRASDPTYMAYLTSVEQTCPATYANVNPACLGP